MLKNWLFGAALLTLSTSSFAADQAVKLPTNAEMTAIFDADQKARQAQDIDWGAVQSQDLARRKRTQALLDAGALNSGDDFLHAAFVFQHGGSPEAYLKAHLLAIIAVAKGSADATWIASATLDRYLQDVGKPQILGTQFSVGSDGRTTQEPFDRSIASDELRKALGVPTLAEQEAKRKSLESANHSPSDNMAKGAIQTSTATKPAKFSTDKPKTATCTQIPGADELLARPLLHWIVVGELHGTTETPDIFADLVCLASTRRAVTVALEQSTGEQPAIDAFISSDGGAAETARFLSSGLWSQPLKDGRSSQAIFNLFRKLRDMRETGHVDRVVAFQPSYTPGPAGFNAGDYEKALATSLVNVVPQNHLALVLVGNVHAMRTAPEWAKPPYLPMAGYLPSDATVLLDAESSGGSYWACTSQTACGPQIAGPSGEKIARRITLAPRIGPFSGTLNIGTAITASPPQPQTVLPQPSLK